MTRILCPDDDPEVVNAIEAALTQRGNAIPPQAAQLRASYLGQQSVETDRA
jgi:hypothetical protein